MKLIPVDELPKKKFKNSKLASIIEEFMKMDASVVMCDKTGYKNAKSLYDNLVAACHSSKFPVKAAMRGDKVYLYKII